MALHSATFDALSDFIRHRMRMSHVYQPVMLMELLKGGGSASVTDIAKALLERDPSQVEYYEQITKNMVGDVLTARNGVTEKIKDGRRLLLAPTGRCDPRQMLQCHRDANRANADRQHTNA